MGLLKRPAEDALAHHKEVGQSCNAQWATFVETTENEYRGRLYQLMVKLGGPPVGFVRHMHDTTMVNHAKRSQQIFAKRTRLRVGNQIGRPLRYCPLGK